MNRAIAPLASLVIGLWIAAAYVWADAWTVLYPNQETCRVAIWQAAVVAQTADPSVREIPQPRECRGFTGEQLSVIAASLARPEPTRAPTPSWTAPSPARTSASPTPRRTRSPRPPMTSVVPTPSPTSASPTPSPSTDPSPTETPKEP